MELIERDCALARRMAEAGRRHAADAYSLERMAQAFLAAKSPVEFAAKQAELGSKIGEQLRAHFNG